MTTSNTSPSAPHESPPIDVRYQRLAATTTFRDAGLDAWLDAELGIVGGGVLGGRITREAVLSGVKRVHVFDFDVTSDGNLGNQFGLVGVPKVQYLERQCDAIRPGVCRGHPYDIRHANMAQLEQYRVLIDCSDDPQLVWTLTEISNGLGIPLLRAAVDGSGEMELGRVLTSGASPDGACQMCSYDLDDLLRRRQRRGCPAGRQDLRKPTRAGGAIGAAIAGLALLQAQRLVTGNDFELVRDREVVLDLSNMQLFHLQLPRSDKCLTGHNRWQLDRVPFRTASQTLGDLFVLAAERAGCAAADSQHVDISFYLHALNVAAVCGCGNVTSAVGTNWAQPPICPACEVAMQWLDESQIDHLTQRQADELGILRTPLQALGIPAGVLVKVRRAGQLAKRLVLCEVNQLCQH